MRQGNVSEWDLPSTVEAQSIERIGGGGYTWESGVYLTTVKMVYLNQSKGGAISFNVLLENANGKELKEAMWVRSGDAKGNKSYYTGRDGVDHPLPGYSVANSMCVAATGTSLAECMASAEKKSVNLYNPELKKEVATERPVLMALLNTSVSVAVSQINEDKTSMNSSGEYVPTGDTRIVNECKFFGNTAGLTTEEILEGKPAVMFDKWAAKNNGVVIDKTSKGTTATESAASILNTTASSTTASSALSMFN